MNILENKKRILNVLTIIIIFLALYIFFTQIHAMVLYDGDDWSYLSYSRYPWPLWKNWNPTRILPEVLMPIAGFISAYIVTPFTGDYVNSVTYTSAFLVSALITIFFALVGIYTVKVLDLPKEKICIFMLLLLLCSFGMFKVNGKDNLYLFHSVNLCCYYYYVISGLLNITLVLYMMIHEDFSKSFALFSPIKQGLIILLVYLAICSNVLHSQVIAIYAGFEILRSLMRKELFSKNGFFYTIVSSIKRQKLFYGIVVFWITALWFECNGGRAGKWNTEVKFFDLPFKKSLKGVMTGFKYNRFFQYFVILVIVVAVIALLLSKDRKSLCPLFLKNIAKNIFCLFFVVVYLILLGAKLNGGYVGRRDVQITFVFFVLIILSLLMGFIIKRFRTSSAVVPILIFFALILSLHGRWEFKESNMRNLNPETCKIVDRHLIKQIQIADMAGKKEFLLTVPKGDDRDNWPHPKYMGANIVRTLYRHGLISRKDIKITIAPNPNMIQELLVNESKGIELSKVATGKPYGWKFYLDSQLSSKTKLNDYLSTLKSNKEKYTILIAVKDEASKSLSKETKALLKDLGLEADWNDANRNSYYAVIDKGNILNEEMAKSKLSSSGSFGDGAYKYFIESMGYEVGNKCSIKINDVEYAKNQRGLNIVAFNHESQTIDSVCFDTYDRKNGYSR